MKGFFATTALAALAVLGQSSPGHAATVEYGQFKNGSNPPQQAVSGVSDLIYGGFEYRVDFFFDSLVDAYGFDGTTGGFAAAPWSLARETATRAILGLAVTGLAAQPNAIFTSVDSNGTLQASAGTTQLTQFRAVIGSFESTSLPGVFLGEVVRGSKDEIFGGTATVNAGGVFVYADITEIAPVPLPVGGAMLLAALGGIAAIRRRRI